MRRAFLTLVVLLAAGCGCHSSSSPSTTQPVDVTGVWIGDFAAKSVSGGECLADTLATNLRPLPTATAVSIAFTQNGSFVDATTTVTSTGVTYSYAGNVGDTIVSVTGTSCVGCSIIGMRCPDGSGTRDLRLAAPP